MAVSLVSITSYVSLDEINLEKLLRIFLEWYFPICTLILFIHVFL